MTEITTKGMIRCATDILLLFGCAVYITFPKWAQPYQRGFFCNDESLMYPYTKSTVAWTDHLIMCSTIPVIVILATEVIGSMANPLAEIRATGGWKIPNWIEHAYKVLTAFAFGSFATLLVISFLKHSTGRLRPYFFYVCQPIMTDGTDCTDPGNHNKYIDIDNYKCLGIGFSEKIIRDARLSFPSGHSSYSAFTMLFCILYTQSHRTWRRPRWFQPFIQPLFILIALFISLSRISDYKHHWSDVLIGLIIGAINALIAVNKIGLGE